MNKQGPIIVIEDDEDDQDLFRMAFENMGLSKQLRIFPNAKTALEYLRLPDVLPFMVISDMNMPAMSGLEMRDILFTEPGLKGKIVPFLFYTTSDNRETVKEAYQLPIQGIFAKPMSISEFERKLKLMVDYWTESMLL